MMKLTALLLAIASIATGESERSVNTGKNSKGKICVGSPDKVIEMKKKIPKKLAHCKSLCSDKYPSCVAMQYDGDVTCSLYFSDVTVSTHIFVKVMILLTLLQHMLTYFVLC